MAIEPAQWMRSSPLLTNNILSEVQRDLMMPIDIASFMANDMFLREWVLAGEQDVERITDYLSTIKDQYGFFTIFFVSEVTGRYYYDGILKTLSQDDAHDIWYDAFKALDVAVDLDVDADEASAGSLMVFISLRVWDEKGDLLGVTGAGLSMTGISQLLAEYKTRFGRTVYVIDSQGVIQAHPDVRLVESIVTAEGIGDVAHAILEQRGAQSYESDREGQRVFAEARFFPEFEWYLIANKRQVPFMNSCVLH